MTDCEYAALDNEALLERIMQQDSRAMEILIERLMPLVRAKAGGFFLIGGDTQDLVQEGTIGLYKAITTYDPKKSDKFLPYAILCITTQIISAIRRDASQKHTALNSSVPLDATTAHTISSPPDSDPQAVALWHESLGILVDAIKSQLSPLETEALRLRLTGMSLTEIAERLGRSKKSVDNALQRMKRKLGKNRMGL